MTLAQFKGGQLRPKLMRNEHFDENHKIDEKYLNIDYASHKEALEERKIDVWVQVNDLQMVDLDKVVLGDLGGVQPVGPGSEEGIVTDKVVEIKRTNKVDEPLNDAQGRKVFGQLEFATGAYTLKMKAYDASGNLVDTSIAETAAPEIDFRYVRKMNLASVPDDVIINGGSGFVQGATDVTAYLNLRQLSLDVYGDADQLTGTGEASLAKDILTQIAEVAPAVFTELATSGGAGKVGVTADPNYTGLTVQAVLTELAARVAADAVSTKEEVLVASGGETEWDFVKGKAQEGTVLLFVNGAQQTPTIHFNYKKDVDNKITGVTFASGDIALSDVLFVQYKAI